MTTTGDISEELEFKHEGGHYSWVIVHLRSGGLTVHEAEMVNGHRPTGKQTDETEIVSIIAATDTARARALVAMQALKEASDE